MVKYTELLDKIVSCFFLSFLSNSQHLSCDISNMAMEFLNKFKNNASFIPVISFELYIFLFKMSLNVFILKSKAFGGASFQFEIF